MNVKKHCEWCGNYSNHSYYRFVIDPKYTIFLDSPFVKEIDHLNSRVILKNGEIVECTQIASLDKIGIYYEDVLPHIFCTEECEDNFINTYASFLDSDLRFQSAVYYNPDEFNPMILYIDDFEYENSSCISCGNIFPNVSKNYTLIPIKNIKIIKGKYKEMPKIDSYQVVQSDINEKHIFGNYYLYEIETNRKFWSEAKFCSNECTFDFAKKNNKLIVFKNNLIKGFITSISEYTVDINLGLKNVYSYRPQIFSKK